MLEIKEIQNNDFKSKIAKKVLYDLEEWFGLPESTKEYINNVQKYPFFAALVDDEFVGFYSVRPENEHVLDMYVLGVLKKYHRKKIGSALQQYANNYAKENNYKHLMVLTLAEKAKDANYLKTRNFYLKEGFIDFYQNDDIFDSFNPCQIMIKILEE